MQAWGLKAKAHLVMNQAQDGKGNKKSFYRYVSTKRKTWGNGPAAKWNGTW